MVRDTRVRLAIAEETGDREEAGKLRKILRRAEKSLVQYGRQIPD